MAGLSVSLFFHPNILFQVSSLQTNLTFMTEKVHILQRDYLQMHDLAIMEIQKLKGHLEELKNKQHSEYLGSICTDLSLNYFFPSKS